MNRQLIVTVIFGVLGLNAQAATSYALLPSNVSQCWSVDEGTDAITRAFRYDPRQAEPWTLYGVSARVQNATSSRGECTLTENGVCLEFAGPRETEAGSHYFWQKAFVHYLWIDSDLPPMPLREEAVLVTLKCAID